ncbi:hypothetical protein [Nonomuraea sp. NPDC005501]|uniref:hypothetical protein n=1 Tax=Nonomuraea sp. NPDC005501 TaxID=3156884 RepID=UPI0033AE94BF
MELLIALASAAAVIAGADRLMLWLEGRGHVRWRRSGRPDLSREPLAEFDALLDRRSDR